MLDKSEITLYTLSCSLSHGLDYFVNVAFLAIQCPHVTSKGHSLVLSPGHTISSICGKDEIRIQFCCAMYLSLLWSVLHGLTQLFLSRRVRYSGYAGPHSDMMPS